MGIAIAASARRHCEERERRSNPEFFSRPVIPG